MVVIVLKYVGCKLYMMFVCEDEYRANANQIKPKLKKLIFVNGSLNIKTPRRRLILGERYWINPTVDKGTLFAPWANHKRGRAVTIPEQISKNMMLMGTAPNDPVPFAWIKMR